MYLLNIISDDKLEQKYGKLLFYMISAGRMVYTQKWKMKTIPNVKDWLIKLYDVIETDKLRHLLKKNSMNTSEKQWEPLIKNLKTE